MVHFGRIPDRVDVKRMVIGIVVPLALLAAGGPAAGQGSCNPGGNVLTRMTQLWADPGGGDCLN